MPSFIHSDLFWMIIYIIINNHENENQLSNTLKCIYHQHIECRSVTIVLEHRKRNIALLNEDNDYRIVFLDRIYFKHGQTFTKTVHKQQNHCETIPPTKTTKSRINKIRTR